VRALIWPESVIVMSGADIETSPPSPSALKKMSVKMPV